MGITVIAFDFGTKSIGCAVGQSITGTAQSLPAFKAQDGIPNWEAIEKCIQDWQPERLVVGLPLNMDGTEQPLTLRAKKFANRLHGRFNLPSYRTNAYLPQKPVARFSSGAVIARSIKVKWMAFQPA